MNHEEAVDEEGAADRAKEASFEPAQSEQDEAMLAERDLDKTPAGGDSARRSKVSLAFPRFCPGSSKSFRSLPMRVVLGISEGSKCLALLT